MMSERKQLKQHLDQELESVTFSKLNDVLAQTHSQTRKQKSQQFLNKEVEIPFVPFMAVIMLFLVFGSFQMLELIQSHSRELVEFQGNIYWSDVIAERMKSS